MSNMSSLVCALNSLKDVDIAFFIICAVIVVLIIAVYFLIPVFNKKLYQEQRDNLHKREAAFKSNLQNNTQPAEETEVEAEAAAEKEAEVAVKEEAEAVAVEEAEVAVNEETEAAAVEEAKPAAKKKQSKGTKKSKVSKDE